MPSEVAPGVHRIGNAYINCYLVEDGDRVTLVDAGLPGFRAQIAARLQDIAAVILTHAHPDHVGMAEKVRLAGARVWVHEADADQARTAKQHPRDGSAIPYLRHAALYKLLGVAARTGGLRTTKIAEVSTFTDGELDVPGRPRVIPTPGHSPGHVAFHLPDRGVLFAGDALCSYNPLTGARGPQLMPKAFAYDMTRALASLAAIEAIDAPVLLFGHGEPWTDGTAAAVARAREFGVT